MKPKTALITGSFFCITAGLFAIFLDAGGDWWEKLFLYCLCSGILSLVPLTLCWAGLKENRMNLLRSNVKERQKHYDELMLAMETCCNYGLAYKEMYAIMKKNPHLRLHRFPPFRAWYKAWVDFSRCMAYDSIKLYSPERDIENDDFYDSSAPPLERYVKEDESYLDDMMEEYGEPKPLTRRDIEEAIEDTLEDYGRRHKESGASKGFAIGVGIGLGNSLTGGHGIGSGN